MMTVADLVSRLIAAGTPPEIAAEVVAEAFTAGSVRRSSAEHQVDAATEKRREYDRERQRKIRELRRQSADNPPMSETPLPSLSPSSQQVGTQKEEKKERALKKNGSALSADWAPSDAHFLEGSEYGFRADEVRGMAEDMRLWAGANANRAVARKSNWNMTFSGWMRREAGKRKSANGKRTVHDAAADLHERVRQFNAPAPNGIRDGTREADVRMLPQGRRQ